MFSHWDWQKEMLYLFIWLFKNKASSKLTHKEKSKSTNSESWSKEKRYTGGKALNFCPILGIAKAKMVLSFCLKQLCKMWEAWDKFLHSRRKTRGKSRNKDEEGKEPMEGRVFKAGLAGHGDGHLSLIPVLGRQGQTDLCELENSLVYIVSSRTVRTV